MATVSVVHFNASPHKLNVLQQTTTNTNNERREIIILRKNAHILPQPKDFNNKEDILLTTTNAGKKRPKGGGVKETRTAPQPMAVARRNARERNRVKQVNNGFANLRQHIPNFIAQTFESSSGRGGNKKLSKVETLRMAVEYIRSLEDLLALDDGSDNGNNSTSSISSFPSPAPPSPALTTHTSMSYSYPTMSPSADEDDLSTNPTPPPPHFIRIDTATNTYQIITNHLYEDSENLEPLNVDDHILSDPSLMNGDLEFSGAQDLSLLNNMHANNSLSPGMYSEQSLSPGIVECTETNSYVSVFNNHPKDDIKLSQIKQEDNHDIPVISLKTENELPQQHKNNVIDVIQWWEQQPSQSIS